MPAVLQKPRVKTRLYEQEELAGLLRSGNKIYGELGRGLSSKINTTEEDLGNLKGKFGEAMIGSMLNILAIEQKEMFIFHSLANPDNSYGETDHVLLYKDKLVLIETKTYNNFISLKVTAEGDLRGVPLSNSKTLRKLDNNNLIEKMAIYEEAFPQLKVHAITAVSRSNVITTSENGKYKVVSLDNLAESLSYHQAQAVDLPRGAIYKHVKSLASLCLR